MRNKKTLLRWLSLFLLIAAVIGVTVAGAAEPTPKAPTGLVLEDMPIVLPANPTDVEKTAAKELQHYLQKLTGNASNFLTEDTALDSAIYIGATQFAEANNVTFTDNNGQGEGWVIEAIGNNLVLTGGETRGVLYAVYHLLEDEFGVRWWNFWEEYVPSLESAVLPFDFKNSGEPVFIYRDIYISAQDTTNLFFSRNRMNGYVSNAPEAYGGEEYFTQPYHVHTFDRYFQPYYKEPTSEASAKWLDAINPDGISWYEAHPEWYAWSDTEQKRISHGQLCLTNDELAQTFSEKMMIAIEMSYKEADEKGIARPKYADITPNDKGGFCECEACKASLAQSGPSGHLLKFVNKVAGLVAEKYPEIKVETLAYWQYFEVPTDDTVPADNVLIRLASSDVDVLHTLDHPNNAQVKERLYKWAARLQPGQLWYWDYAMNLRATGSYPNWFKYQPDYQKFYEVGGAGIFTELEYNITQEFWDLKVWLMTKIIENPYVDQYALTKDFLSGYYGEAAAEDLYDYLIFTTQSAEDYYEPVTYNTVAIKAPWMTAEEVLYAYGLFEAAVAKTEADTSISETDRQLYLNRINAARSSLDRQIIESYNTYVEEMGANNDPTKIFDIDKMEVGRRYVNSVKWLRDMQPMEDHTGVEDIKNRGTYNDIKNILYSYKVYDSEEYGNPAVELPELEIPEQIFEDHPGISTRHIYDFPGHTLVSAASYMTGMYDVENGASYYGGTAVMWDMEELYQKKDKDYVDLYYAFTEKKGMQTTLAKTLYLNNPVIADGEYHLYRIPEVTTVTAARQQIYFFGDTVYVELGNLNNLKDKKVDVYVNLKVLGDPTGTDKQNYAKIYLDRVLIVEPCNANYQEQIPATCASNAAQKGYCIVCGKDCIEEFPYTKLPHTVTSGYTFDAANNIYTADCSVCGEAAFKVNGQIPEELMKTLAEDGTSLDFVYDLDVDDFKKAYPSTYSVEDADSAVGRAVYWNLKELPESSVQSYFKISDTQYMQVAYNKLPKKLYAKDIIADGKYHLYKFEDVPLVTETDSKLILFNWTFQADFAEFPIKGQKVDLYLSMKVDGELQFDDPTKLPAYYIDRILVVGACENHKTEAFVYDAATHTYEGRCDNCSGMIRKQYTADLPQEVLDALTASGSNIAHVHEYTGDQLLKASVQPWRGVIDDPTATTGKALKYDTSLMSADSRKSHFIFSNAKNFALNHYLSSGVGGGTFGTIPTATLKVNAGDGKYHCYKWSGVLVPEKHAYTYAFDWSLQLSFGDIKSNLVGKPVELYLYMKVDGDPTYTGDTDTSRMPKYYIDRVIVADNCGNHLDADALSVTKNPTCVSNAVASGECALCGRQVSGVELEGTMLSHEYGEYEYDKTSGNYVATCINGCGDTRIKGELPQMVLDDLTAAGLGVEHVHEYSALKFERVKVFTMYEDKNAACGWAVRGNAWDSKPDPGKYILYANEYWRLSQQPGGQFGTLTYATLRPDQNKGYHIYKYEDVKLDDNLEYLDLFHGDLLVTEMAELAGKTVDLYISVKVTGDLKNDSNRNNGPVYYVDRVIAVDTCEDYEIPFEENKIPCQTAEDQVGYCPVCGKEFLKPGTAVDHSFSTYKMDKLDKNRFVADCDYGCGATDVKWREALTMEERLPAELPQNVKNHVIVSYIAGEISIGTQQWDPELDRPVGVRAYEDAPSALNMTRNRGLTLIMWRGGNKEEKLGTFTTAEMVANSGKGYQLYCLDDIIPIEYEENQYVYMFADWGVYIEMFDDDLKDYKDQLLDVYLYMKVEGDPSCLTDDPPTYYIDQVIVAKSCEVDETWTVTKEPTCTAQGEAVGNCSVCGLQGSVVNLPMAAHKVINSYVKEAATCKENMIVEGYCTVCKLEYRQMEVENSKLTHAFTKYKAMDDGSGREMAFCDNGCGARDIRNANGVVTDVTVPESIQQLLPVLGGASIGGGDFSFTDIKSSDWYFQNVKDAWKNGLINGVTATEFRPNETLTMAQAIKLASAYHEKYNTGSVTLTNGAGNWYSSYVDYAVDNGIIDSKYASYDTAKMNKAIDRSEFVSIFANAMDEASLVGYNEVADNAIPDVKMTDNHAKAIYQFYRAGILTGSDAKGTFNPDSSIKRSEVAAILSRMFDESVRQSIILN